MNDELKPLYELLTAQFGWLPAIVAWIGTIRVPARLFSDWIQSALTRAVSLVLASPEKDDDELLQSLLNSKPYRLLAFAVDLLASVKLPTTASLQKHNETKP